MTHTHKLSTQNHFDFLNQDRKDPITGDLIKENDEIVICSSCKSAFLKESWEYLGNTHCEQNDTLEIIPKQSKLELKTSLITSIALTSKKVILTRFFGVLIAILLGIILFIFTNSFFIIGIITTLIPISVVVLFTPTTHLDIYSSHLVTKGVIGKVKTQYEEIKYITINCNNTKSTSSYIHIKQTNGVSTKIPLEKKYLQFYKNEELLDFAAFLSRYTQVVLKVDSCYENIIKQRNVPAKIELI